MKCKNCGHELEIVNETGRTLIRHKHEATMETVEGDYYFCSEKVIDCEKCMKERICDCREPKEAD